MSNVIPFNYQGQPVRFNSHGWINATAAATAFGREPRDWLRLHEAEEYMRVLAKHLGIPFSPRMVERRKSKKVSGGKSGFRPELSNCEGLVVTRRGSTANGGGTWLHPKLAVVFARWLDIEFAVWCDLHIDALLRGDLRVKENYSSAQQALLQAKEQASKSGAELAGWRWSKGSLQQQVEYWGGQLSLMLQDQSDDYEGF